LRGWLAKPFRQQATDVAVAGVATALLLNVFQRMADPVVQADLAAKQAAISYLPTNSR